MQLGTESERKEKVLFDAGVLGRVGKFKYLGST